MKQFYLIVMIVTTFLIACTDSAIDTTSKETADVTAENVKLTRLEDSLLNLIGDFPTIVELHIQNEAAKEIKLTVDHYENGELQNTKMYFTSSLNDIDFTHPIHVIVARNVLNEKQQWIGSVITKDSSSSIQTDFEQEQAYSSATFDEISTPVSFVLGEKKIIGAYIMKKDDASEINNTIKTKNDLTDPSNDHVYVYYLLVK